MGIARCWRNFYFYLPISIFFYMEYIIACRNLTHRYGKRTIYENLSFGVPKGKILGLLGKNGTGKTTAINILSGYLEPESGECQIFGENIRRIRPSVRQRIGLLIEGHIQYSFMTIREIEKFYAPFYPRWNRDAYYELMNKLKVAPGQRISRMSCGQRSQVALGLILAQNPEVLILDDFSLGLDPGYRRLFTDYLRDYAKSEEKTVFLTSHIIQDMERLIDDCIVLDYGKILIQKSVKELLATFRHYTFLWPEEAKIPNNEAFYHPSLFRNQAELYSFLPETGVREILEREYAGYAELRSRAVDLEDAFIGLTGKY